MGEPDMLQFMGLQKVGHNLAIEQQYQIPEVRQFCLLPLFCARLHLCGIRGSIMKGECSGKASWENGDRMKSSRPFS